MIFARQLSADYLGVNGLFSNILSMLSLTELGIGTAMIYELYKPVALNDEKRITSYMKLYGTAYKIIGLVISILGVMLVPFLKFLINKPANIPENIYVLYLLFLFSTASSYFFSYRSSILIANQKYCESKKLYSCWNKLCSFNIAKFFTNYSINYDKELYVVFDITSCICIYNKYFDFQ